MATTDLRTLLANAGAVNDKIDILSAAVLEIANEQQASNVVNFVQAVTGVTEAEAEEEKTEERAPEVSAPEVAPEPMRGTEVAPEEARAPVDENEKTVEVSDSSN